MLPKITKSQLVEYLSSYPHILAKKVKKSAQVFPFYYSVAPFSILSIDVIYLPSFKKTRQVDGRQIHNHFGFCILDYFSKYLFGIYTERISAENAKKCLQKFLNEKKYDKQVKSKLIHDSGKEFLNKKFIDFCERSGIKQIVVNPFLENKAQMVERSFRTLRQIINYMKSASPSLKYPELFYYSIDRYNETIHGTINIPPEEALKEQNIGKVESIYYMNRLKEVGKNINLVLSSKKDFTIGDKVYIVKPKHMRGKFQKTGASRVYDTTFFIVSDIIKGDVQYFYRLRNPKSHKLLPSKFTSNMLVKIPYI